MTTDEQDRWVDYLPLAELRRALRNPKAHALDDLGASFRRHGVVELPTLDERTGRLVAGHGRLEQLERAEAAGERPPRGVKVGPDGRWLAPTLRGWRSGDDAEAEAYVLTSNRLTEVGGWLPELDAMLVDLAGAGTPPIGWTTAELDAMVAQAAAQAAAIPATTPPLEPDDDPAVVAIPRDVRDPTTKPGDLWLLGRHRLKVGDSFSAADLAHLLGGRKRVDMIATDPPFAIYGSSSGVGADIADDKMIRPFFAQLGKVMAGALEVFAHCYVCCDWRSFATVWDGAKGAGLSPKNCLIWDKGVAGLGANYANTYEMVAYFARLPAERAMKSTTVRGQRTVYASNIWRGNRPHGAERLHNAAKPVDLFAWLIGNSTDAGGTVLDLFGGSGVTVIAAERTGRDSFTMELDPANADLIAYRYQRDFGTLPQLIARRPDPDDPDSVPVDLAEPQPVDFVEDRRVHTFGRRADNPGG